MTAAAISDPDWRCPVLHLAERAGDTVRVTVQSRDHVALDDTLGAGPAAGFALPGAEITGVEIAGDDPRAVLLHYRGRPEGRLFYAAHPEARLGGLRNADWALKGSGGGTLRQWALPAVLPVTGL